MSLIGELKRRNVFRVGAAYCALGWIVTQVTAAVVPALNLPDSLNAIVVWIGIVGFPFVVLFSWVYELTPEGLKREKEVDRSESITRFTGRRLDAITIALLLVAIGLFAVDRFVLRDRMVTTRAAASASAPDAAVPADSGAEPVNAARPPQDKSVAVLPFVNLSADREQEFFSDGLADELLNVLANFEGLHVTARTSSFSFKGKNVPVQEIGKALGVANLLEGSVRKSGNFSRALDEFRSKAEAQREIARKQGLLQPG